MAAGALFLPSVQTVDEWLHPTHYAHKQIVYIADRDVPPGSCYGLDRELPWK
jgi:hypothetical protein